MFDVGPCEIFVREVDHADDHTEQVGAPVVLQVVGPKLEDERTLALARVVADSLSE